MNDINAGKGFAQAIADAGAYLSTQPDFSTITDIVALVSDIIRMFIDSGVLPTPKLEHAKNMLVEAQTLKLPTK